MPFVVLIQADGTHYFLLSDSKASIIGFETNIEALEYYEIVSLQIGSSDPPPPFQRRNGYKAFAPSIVDMPVFRDLVQNILAKKPEPLLLCSHTESRVAITTGRAAKEYWANGRHKALYWLRKNEGRAKTKLMGREQEIIKWLKLGLVPEHISQKMGVHPQTIRHHMSMMDLWKYFVKQPTERKNNGIHKKTSPRKRS